MEYNKAIKIASYILGTHGISNGVDGMEIVHDLIAEDINITYKAIRNRILIIKNKRNSVQLGEQGKSNRFLIETSKICKTCKEELPLSAFTISKNPNGWITYPHCKPCKAMLVLEYHHLHKHELWYKELKQKQRRKYKQSAYGKLRTNYDAKRATEKLTDGRVRAILKVKGIEPTATNMEEYRETVFTFRKIQKALSDRCPDRETLVKLYLTLTMVDISKKYGVSKDRVRMWFRKADIKRRYKRTSEYR